MLYRGKLRLAVGKSVLGLHENHSGRQHIGGELGVVTCPRMYGHMGYAALGCRFLNVADKLFVIINGVAVPRLFYLAFTACPLFVAAAFNYSEYLFKRVGVLVADID